MNINLDFYKEKQEELLPIEEEIVKYINENKEKDYYDIIKKDNRIEVILALSTIRNNILSWYPFKSEASVLEIEPNFGEITGLLCDKVAKVVAIESNLKKARAIQKRYEEKENLEVIIGDIEDIKIQEKFDYITLIGTLEKYNKQIVEKYIKELKEFLKEDGIIILATDNELGMQLFTRTNDTGINVTNLLEKNLYTLHDIEELLQKNNLIANKVYYPMPDYKLTNVIYTDQKNISKSDLSRNIVYNTEDTIKFYSENLAYEKILKEDTSKFKLFANSFLIEATKKELDNNKIKFVSFSNIRKPEYRIKTIMEDKNVYKYAENEKSKKHLEDIKKNIDIMKKIKLKTIDGYEDNRIVSKYTDALSLDKVITNLIQENNKDEIIDLIRHFKEEIDTKLEKTDNKNNVFDKYKIDYIEADLEQMQFVKQGLWDLIFQNCFYIEKDFYFYDQEWREEKVPIDFILYRAIKYFTKLKEYISEKELYSILQINENVIKLFEELDNKIQEEIRDETVWKIHNSGKEIVDLKREKLTDNHHINLLTIENEQNRALLEQKQKEIDELKNNLNYIINSKSWKITKPLRAIKKIRKKYK